MKDTNNKYVHYYKDSISTETPSATKQIRLAQEYADISRNLPCAHTDAIFVRVDKDQMDIIKVLIMGSAGTPYAHGAFEFDISFDANYPTGPPKVNLMTTGAGQVRFNPNLYATGKVCLSLLGTWRGNATENWDPKISTLLQVLISIQSIIMSELVYFNEPSCESEMGKPEGEAKNEAYSNIVRYCNIKFAMIDQIKKPSKGFEEAIRRHFYLKKEMILTEVRQWIERSKTAEAKYTSFSYDHNPTWAQKFSSAKNYTKLLEEVYAELEKELNNLPIPSELKAKTEESERISKENKNMKLNEKMEFINLESIDMEYDKDVKNKEMNINEDEVKDRWSRYIGAMGIDAVKKQSMAKVFLSGASGMGIEIAKNIVLSGVNKFVLHDTKKATYNDLNSQFFLSEEDIGKNRAEASIKKLQQLNVYVKIFSSTSFLPKEESEIEKFFKDFTVVILTQCDYETQILINNFCRKNGIFFISADLFGVFGRVISDFGDKFIVNDINGEDLTDCFIKNITNEEEGVVTILDNTRHNFSDGDEVIIDQIHGMELLNIEKINKIEKSEITNLDITSINMTKHKVKIINPHTFKIGDTTKYGKYIRNGVAKSLKTKKELVFNGLDKILITKNSNDIPLDQNLIVSDFTKMGYINVMHYAFEALDIFTKTKKSYPELWNITDAEELLKDTKILAEKNGCEVSESDEKIILYFSFTCQTQFGPLAAFFGGLIAQEIIKSITNKFGPIQQVFYFDSKEVLPEIDTKNLQESVKNLNIKNLKARGDGLLNIIGPVVLAKIEKMKILVVGAGAIGCEVLKNFAMLGVGTDPNTEEAGIVITDPDVIELSNLSRQFLFREKHLRKPKSSTAGAAIMSMNPKLKNHVYARLDKMWDQTENIFSDKFFQGLSIVTNALDNVAARRYVDGRCVTNRIPLLESRTLGAKGHVQVVIPFKTESYSSQQDPEVVTDNIPVCTLKMFPEEILHCIEWARDRFGKLFNQKPKNFNRVKEEGPQNQDYKLLANALRTIKKWPKNFDDCIKASRDRFQKFFNTDVRQLLFSYPLDKVMNNGSLFWTLPKRPPQFIEFNKDDILHASFIAAYACLEATVFNIKIPYDSPRSEASKLDMAKKAAEIKYPDFVPNEEKAKKIEATIEKANKEKEDKEKKENDGQQEELLVDTSKTDEQKKFEEMVKTFETLLDTNKDLVKKELIGEEFEKDNDANYHIDIIYSMSNLRAVNYKLEQMDWVNVKLKAGRIIPALATTTAAIAGLQSLELVKIAKGSVIEDVRNSFINLAIPYIQYTEPGPIAKFKLKEDLSVNLWDRWEFKPETQTLKSVYKYLKEKYGLFPKDCFKGNFHYI